MTLINTPYPENFSSRFSWWHDATIYEVYVRSFCDLNGDGIGDLPGVTAKLPYLKWLGVRAVWLTPFYPSPMADFGYDVSDFCEVDPLFGSLGDFDTLIQEAHRLGLKVIIDFVPNHTSDEHQWFKDARQSRHSEKRNWYIWADPDADGGPPNNWVSRFGGGPAWTLDPKSGQYYLHSFLPSQPDLNWHEPKVRAAMAEVLRFWLRRRVDGIRVDVCDRLIKDRELRCNPPNPCFIEGMDPAQRYLQTYSKNLPENLQINSLFRSIVDEFNDILLIGESYLPPEELIAYYGTNDGYHLPFNFSLIFANWNPNELRKIVEEYERLLPDGAWPSWVLGNHDRPRVTSRFGSTDTKLAMTFLLSLRGTPTIYYGDEIGLPNVPIPPEKFKDPWGVATPDRARDRVRTPMQWSPEANAGFCLPDIEPWLPVSHDWTTRNVETMSSQRDTILAKTRELLHLRAKSAALRRGRIEFLVSSDDELVFRREAPGERLVVQLNFSEKALALPIEGTCIFATESSVADKIRSESTLPAKAGVILKK